MDTVLIEYVTEGDRRGYTITHAPPTLDEAARKRIWQTAMPRGQGWGAYVGAHAVKCFALDDGRLALADVRVTDQRDESGRGGIRRAEVAVLSASACAEVLTARLAAYPAAVQAAVERKPTIGQWARLMDAAMPKLHADSAVVVSAAYTDAAAWQAVEAFTIRLALARRLPLRRVGRVAPFTTLALDVRDEARLVAVPQAHVKPAWQHVIPL